MRNKFFEKAEKSREERFKKYAELKLAKLANVEQNQVEEQFGYAIGEIIVLTKLPTLNIDGMISRSCIEVSKEEEVTVKILNDKWLESYSIDKNSDDSKKSWSELSNYRHEMEEKYLPKELECIFFNIFVKDWESFKKGIRASLWDSDICHYDIDTNDCIRIDNSDNHYTKIILNLTKY